MIKELPESKGAILAFEISGKISLDEEKAWLARFDRALEEHDKVSVLLIINEHASWEAKAMYEDLKWLFKHLRRFDKVAFVTDSKVWKWLVAIDSKFAKLLGISEKHFEPSERDAALEWLN